METIYNIKLTKDEIMTVEEALYDRASVLYAIGDQLLHAGSNEQSKNLDKRASKLEHIASLIAYPIDQEHIKNYNGINSNIADAKDAFLEKKEN